MNLTLANYTIFSVLLIFLLYFIVVNSNVKKQSKSTPKPKLKPMKLFRGTNGFSEKKINDFLKLK